jgi:hypothetical protein
LLHRIERHSKRTRREQDGGKGRTIEKHIYGREGQTRRQTSKKEKKKKGEYQQKSEVMLVV